MRGRAGVGGEPLDNIENALKREPTVSKTHRGNTDFLRHYVGFGGALKLVHKEINQSQSSTFGIVG